MISTQNLEGLPDLVGFRRLTQSLAVLDAVLCSEWGSRCYSFNSGWTDGGMMASMRDGCGDDWFALISEYGTALVGLAHEAPTFEVENPRPWVFRDLPEEFREGVQHEPVFDAANSTFCIWRLASDGCWRSGVPTAGTPVEDGSDKLLSILAGDPQQYAEFASDYYEVDVDLGDVAEIYAHTPLTPELATRMNGDVDYSALREDLREIGYPGPG